MYTLSLDINKKGIFFFRQGKIPKKLCAIIVENYMIVSGECVYKRYDDA